MVIFLPKWLASYENGYLLTKMVIFLQKWLSSYENAYLLAKMVIFLRKWLSSYENFYLLTKMVIFLRKWLSSYENGYLLTKKVKHRGIVKVRPFTTVKVSCLQDHVKPTIRDVNTQQIILHLGTNDLQTEQTARQITKSVIDLSKSLKKNEKMIAISGIVPRLDELNNKAVEVNSCLELMCSQRGLPYISHRENIDTNKHLNGRNLHLNSYGFRVWQEIFQFFCPGLININLR